MARYRHLPIRKAAMDLAVHLEQAVRRFSRYHKYTLGSELRQTAQRLCRLVARANDARRAEAPLAVAGLAPGHRTPLTLSCNPTRCLMTRFHSPCPALVLAFLLFASPAFAAPFIDNPDGTV